jgi:dipeptidyl aminopeptidase/acylaminoacyl peptidase
MTDFPTDRALRDALVGRPSDPGELLSSIQAEVLRTPQRRGRLRLPWVLPLDATEGERHRVALVRWALVALALVAAAVAGLAAGSALSQRPILGGPITFVRNGQVLDLDPISHVLTTVDAFAGLSVSDLQASPTGQLLVRYANPSGSGPEQIGVFGADGRPGPTLEPPPGSIILSETLSWAPDGKSILGVVSTGGRHRLAIFEAATGLGRSIGPDDLVAERGVWSPDGRSIAFRGPIDGGNNIGVYRLDVASGAVEVLVGNVEGQAGWSRLTWSPDGDHVAFDVAELGRPPSGIWSVNVTTLSETRVTPDGFAAGLPAWSPDGRWIALGRYVHIGNDACTADLFVVRPDGSDLHELLPNAITAGWSPDGQWVIAEVVARTAGLGELSSGLPGAPLGGIAIVRPDASDLRVLYSYTTADAGLTVIPSGCAAGSYAPRWQPQP